MTREVEEMIRELVQMLEVELKTAIEPEIKRRLESELCLRYGGERIYVPKLPKLVTQVRVAALGTGLPSDELSLALGKSKRQIRRILRGR